MRGYKQPAHCPCGVPHASDHSSPAHRQSYDASQTLLFSASVGIRLSTRGKGVLPNCTRGGARFRRRGNRRGFEKASDSRLLSKRIGRFTRRVRPGRTSRSACCLGCCGANAHPRAATAPTLPRHTSAHHRLKPARWILPAAIAPVSYNSHGCNPSTAAFLPIRTFRNDRR